MLAALSAASGCFKLYFPGYIGHLLKITDKSTEFDAFKPISKVNISVRTKNFTFLHETRQ